jgi:hypothetical protein
MPARCLRSSPSKLVDCAAAVVHRRGLHAQQMPTSQRPTASRRGRCYLYVEAKRQLFDLVAVNAMRAAVREAAVPPRPHPEAGRDPPLRARAVIAQSQLPPTLAKALPESACTRAPRARGDRERAYGHAVRPTGGHQAHGSLGPRLPRTGRAVVRGRSRRPHRVGSRSTSTSGSAATFPVRMPDHVGPASSRDGHILSVPPAIPTRIPRSWTRRSRSRRLQFHICRAFIRGMTPMAIKKKSGRRADSTVCA